MERQHPPGPQGPVGLGNQREYNKDRLGFLTRCQREYGDVFAFSDTSIVVLDPELIHQLHARTNAEFVTEVSMFSGKKPTQWLLSTIDTTMANRRKQWRGVSRSATANKSPGMVAVFDRVMSHAAGDEVDVNDTMMRLAGHTSADFCLGGDEDFDTLTELVAAVDSGVRSTMFMMNSSQRFPVWLPLPRHRRFKAAARRLRDLVYTFITRRRDSTAPDGPRDLLDTLLDNPEADTRNIALTLNLMLRASYSIPGAALTWAVRELARRPELTAKLRAENSEIDDPSQPLRPFAEAFVKEILRMYPPSWLGGREVRQHTTLGGWDLSAGDQVMFSPFVVQRDPRFWDRPAEFDPNRWMSRKPPHSRHAYFPFGAGPRICIGNQLGMLELILHVARLAERFDIEVTNMESAPMTARTVLTPDGLRARFTPRED